MMGFKCRNCGSNIKYNINKRKLECESCGSFFEVSQYSSSSSADIAYGVFHCKSCGAELLSMDEEQSVFCSYCGSQAFLSEKTNRIETPKKIIPFKLSKEKVKETYKESLKGQFFLPKEFSDEDFMEEFRGIYIPYWQTSVDIEDIEIEMTGTKSYTKDKFDYYEKYEMGVRFTGNIKTGSNDASYFFDDTISDSISPFKNFDQVDFKEGYLAGFYADKATVSNDLYLDYGKKIALKCLDHKMQSVGSVTIHDDSWKKKINLSPKTDGISLFPVWFLTWRRKNRVAYSVVNGQTGTIITDLPVDYKAFFKCVGISTLILFILLSLLPIFVLPLKTASIAGNLMWLSTYLLYLEIQKIGMMESHRFDYGYRGKKRRPIKKGPKIVLRVIMWAIMFLSLLLGIYCEVPGDLADVCEIVFFMTFIMHALIIINGFSLKNKLIFAVSVIGMIGNVVTRHLASLMDPHDSMNYIIAFIYLGIMVFNAVITIYYMNYLTTRPVPNFFNREGANNNYEAD